MAEPALRLPSFDELRSMARDQPEALENLRQRLTEELIQNAHPRGRQRLRGLVFVIEAERRKARNPLQACIRISQMMLDSALELQASLNQLGSGPQTREHAPAARIIPFARRDSAP